MTFTGYELYNSRSFWWHRYVMQQLYIHRIENSVYHWDGRKEQLLTSAKEMLDVMYNRLKELPQHG
jgi:hypothetical protein